jgi:hypothetical protein
MSLGFKLPVHKLELEGITLYFKEASIADMKKIQEIDAENAPIELFKLTYCNENGQKIEVKDEEISELPMMIASEIFKFIAKINNGQKKS